MSNQNNGPTHNKLVKGLLDFERAFDTALRWFLIALLSTMVAIVFYQVVSRRFFDRPLAWGEEIARYLTLWTVFLAMGYVLSTGRFVGVEFVVERFPRKVQVAFAYFRLVLILVFALVVFSRSIELVALVEKRDQITPALRFRMSHVYSAIPIGSGILIFKTMMMMLKMAIGANQAINPRSESGLS